MDFNGIVLISSVLDFGHLTFAPGHDRSYVALPALLRRRRLATTTSCRRRPNLAAFLDEVRQFAPAEYAAALDKGSALPAPRSGSGAQQLAGFTGLSEDYLDRPTCASRCGQFIVGADARAAA